MSTDPTIYHTLSGRPYRLDGQPVGAPPLPGHKPTAAPATTPAWLYWVAGLVVASPFIVALWPLLVASSPFTLTMAFLWAVWPRTAVVVVAAPPRDTQSGDFR